MTPPRLPTYYLSHGGGPWPWMAGRMGWNFDRLRKSLEDVRAEVGDAPKAVLVVSGHWESDRFLVSSAAEPPMVFDYYGFPEDTYRIRYAAPGDPALAEDIAARLGDGGLASGLDPAQGYDHGTFSLMKILYPDADIPTVQLSMRADYDPAAHLEAGRLLAPLRDEGVLIIGSGSSYHNMRGMNGSGSAASQTFDAWLGETLTATDPAERSRRLKQWVDAPAARAAHPREDHLIPLMVALGAAEGEPGTRVYHQADLFGGVAMSSFRFGAVPDPAPAQAAVEPETASA